MPGNSDFQVKHEYFSRCEHVNITFLSPRQTNLIYKWICIAISSFTIIKETNFGCTECGVLEGKNAVIIIPSTLVSLEVSATFSANRH